MNAQRKEIGQARTFIKSGKNLDKAEKLMRDLLKDSVHKENMKVHAVLCEALRKQYLEANMKLYLKQKMDTTALFNLTRNMFLAHEALDSLDARPNKKGEVKLSYREKNAQFLNTYRRNLFNGGVFYVNKQQYENGLAMFESYIDCVRQPLFASYNYPDSPEAAYWALFCCYKLQDTEKALKYADTALDDTAHLEFALEYLCEIYQQKNDMIRYEQTLRDGFYKFKDSKYFFTYLVDYYNSVHQSDSALGIVNEALEHNDSSELYLYAKSNILLNIGKYKECAELCDTLIARNKQFADAYYNAGLAYLNQALVMKRDLKNDAKSRKQLNDLYRKSLPYMERYRVMAPDQKDKWATALYNIYLQLNMGKQFVEIDKLLR